MSSVKFDEELLHGHKYGCALQNSRTIEIAGIGYARKEGRLSASSLVKALELSNRR